MPEGVPPFDLPPQPAVFAPDYAPEDIAQIAAKLRDAAGLPEGADGRRRERLTLLVARLILPVSSAPRPGRVAACALFS